MTNQMAIIESFRGLLAQACLFTLFLIVAAYAMRKLFGLLTFITLPILVLTAGCSGEENGPVRNSQDEVELCNRTNITFDLTNNAVQVTCRQEAPLPTNVSARAKDIQRENVAGAGHSVWHLNKLCRYGEELRDGRDFRRKTTLEEVLSIANEIERDIHDADKSLKTTCMYEYLILAIEFGDAVLGKSVDEKTNQIIYEEESFNNWSNRLDVSYSFLQRALEFARENGFRDDAMASAYKYRRATSQLRQFLIDGNTNYADVLNSYVSTLGDELDREDGILKRAYDYYRSLCPTDKAAKPMLERITQKMGRRPRWAKKED